MGGNYDALFLECPSASLGFIYKSLGCFHSLQQDKDPFAAPSIPALNPAGFVRWQTVQVLLNPEEHVSYLQEAVKRFELLNNGSGGPFPKTLPADCLPKSPDTEMLKWHERVGDRLRLDSEAQAARSAPATARNPNFRPADLESVTDASFDSNSAIDAAEYFQNTTISPKRPSYTKSMPITSPNDRFAAPQDLYPGRRRSSRNPRSPDYAEGPTPTHARLRPHYSPRGPQPASVESASSSSSESRSPPRHHRNSRNHPRIRMSDPNRLSPRSQSAARSPTSPLRDEHGRRHSSHLLANVDKRDFVPQPPPPQPNISSRASQTLSPPFFAGQNGRPSVSPTGPTMPPPTQSSSAPLPQGQFPRTNGSSLRSKVNYGTGPIDSWRSKLNAYVNGPNTGPAPQPQGGRRRSQSGGLDLKERDPPMEGVRFVEGVGGLDERDNRRRRREYEREWDSEREDRRRERRERRRSAGYEDD